MAKRPQEEQPGADRAGRDLYSRPGKPPVKTNPDAHLIQPPTVERDPAAGIRAAQHWERMLRHQRWRNRLFGALVALSFAGIGAYLYHQHTQQAARLTALDASPVGTRPTPQGIRVKMGGPLEGDVLPSLTFLLDDLRNVDARTEPPDGGADMEIRWVKLAGAELVRAEDAMREGRTDRALLHYQRAAAIFPDMKGVQAFIGLIHLQNQRYAESITHLSRAAVETPLDHALLNNLGVAFLATKDYEQAEKYFKECTRLSPRYAMGWYNLGSLYFEQENFDRVAEIMPTYLKLNSTNLEAAQMYARALIVQQRWGEAALILEEVATQEPDVPTVLFRLAQCRAMTGDTDGGMEALTRAVAQVDRTRALGWLSRNDFNQLRDEPSFKELVFRLTDEK